MCTYNQLQEIRYGRYRCERCWLSLIAEFDRRNGWAAITTAASTVITSTIHHWADGGETRPENLVTLCRYHPRRMDLGTPRAEEPVHIAPRAAAARTFAGVGVDYGLAVSTLCSLRDHDVSAET